MKKMRIDYIRELLLTFSNKSTLLSSKKIERFIVFMTFITVTVYYLSIHIKELTVGEFLEIIGVWLTYGGYNSLMNYKDKKVEAAVDSEAGKVVVTSKDTVTNEETNDVATKETTVVVSPDPNKSN
jgi:Ca2+/Na+ antiporter